jgi:hypothetical protein
MRSFILVLVLAAGCGAGNNPEPPDAHTSGVDAMSGGPDAGSNVCTGLPYDSCKDTTNWTDCLNGVECRNFLGAGFTVCTPHCDTNNPCPNSQDGTPVTCNTMGRCKPDMPNSCTLPP